MNHDVRQTAESRSTSGPSFTGRVTPVTTALVFLYEAAEGRVQVNYRTPIHPFQSIYERGAQLLVAFIVSG
jgi:hypothetical protein